MEVLDVSLRATPDGGDVTCGAAVLLDFGFQQDEL